MIAKKNSRFDLEQKRTALFPVGLLAAGSFTLAAFTYGTGVPKESDERVFATHETELFLLEQEPLQVKQERPVEIPQTSQREEPQMSESGLSPQISEDMQETGNTSSHVQPVVTPPFTGPIGDPGKIIEDPIDPWPTTPAYYCGGVPAMQEKIYQSVNYPEIDRLAGIEGTVHLSFVIERDGTVSNVKVERSVSETIDREAVRVVNQLNKWIPAQNAHGKVRTTAHLPIRFMLSN